MTEQDHVYLQTALAILKDHILQLEDDVFHETRILARNLIRRRIGALKRGLLILESAISVADSEPTFNDLLYPTRKTKS